MITSLCIEHFTWYFLHPILCNKLGSPHLDLVVRGANRLLRMLGGLLDPPATFFLEPVDSEWPDVVLSNFFLWDFPFRRFEVMETCA